MTSARAALGVLVVGNAYPPHTLGGYELLCRDHVAWLRGRGHDVTVLTTTYGVDSAADEVGESGEHVVRALRFQWSDFRLRRLSGMELWREERRQRRVLETVIHRARPDIVIVWHMAAVSKSLLATIDRRGLAMLAVVGEPWPAWDIEADAWLSMWRRPAIRRWKRIPKAVLRGGADRVVAPVDADAAVAAMVPLYCSDHLRRHVEAELVPWRGRGRVVPNGVDLRRFASPPPAGRAFHRPLRLLYLGRVERRKGLLTAVEALSVLEAGGLDCVLDVVGWRDEAYAAEVRERADQLGVARAVVWHDAVPAARVPAVLAEHDVLVFPTIWEEPFGLVPLEALAAGCLVVATGTGGSGEFLVDAQTALRFPVGDAAALARRVADLAADAELRTRLRRNGRRCAEEHSFDRFAEGIEAAAEELLATG